MISTASNVANLSGLTAAADDVCIVTDSLKGGLFAARSGTPPADSGNNFASATAGTYWSRLFQGEIEASWYGAVPDGKITGTTISGTDSSSALRSALSSTVTYPAGDPYTSIKRRIMVNNGDYLINDAISVRKGQHLQGAGMGATVITGGTTGKTEKAHILLGLKLNTDGTRGAADDPGNVLPATISDLLVRGTQTDRSGILTGASAAVIENIVFYKGNTGVDSTDDAANTFIQSCIFNEMDGTAIKYSSFGALINNCYFYKSVFGILIKGKAASATPDYSLNGANDNHISNCIFALNRPANEVAGDRWAIRLSLSNGDRLANTHISNCVFTYNGSNVSQDAVIVLSAKGQSGIRISNCEFSNWSGWAIADRNTSATPTSAGTYIEHCSFDGNPSSSLYSKAQNGTANLSKGIFLKSGTYYIVDCIFSNFYTDATTGAITLDAAGGVTLYISSQLVSLIKNNNTGTGNTIIPI